MSVIIQTATRRGGRKANEWTAVTLDEILGFLSEMGITQSAFAAHIGVTNSTFHNWKKGKCAPDEDTQGKIRSLIDGENYTKEIQVVKKKGPSKAPAKKGRGGSLLSLLDSKKLGATRAASTKTKKKAKKAAAKAVAPKKAKVAVAEASGLASLLGSSVNGTAKTRVKKKRGKLVVSAVKPKAPKAKKPRAKKKAPSKAPKAKKVASTEWTGLKDLGKFLRANPGKSGADIAALIEQARALSVLVV